MEFIDTHCHIQSAGLVVGERTTRELWRKAPDLQPETIIDNARVSNVTKLVCVGCDLEDSQLAVNFANAHEGCWASIGIHPHEAKGFVGRAKALNDFASLATQPRVVAVGECGLDYYYTHSPKEAQIELLHFQLKLAKEHDLPVIFHVREAFDDFWPIFKQYPGISGVLHSFTDSALNLQKARDAGLYIGVNGIATFVKNPDQLDVYRSIPLSSLLLETDAPFLTPTPYRGKVNQPSHIPFVAEFLATLRKETVGAIAEATTANANRLFGGMR